MKMWELRAINGIFSLQNKEQQRQLKEILNGFACCCPAPAPICPFPVS